VNCRHPFHLFLQLDLSDPALGVSLQGLPFLWILNCLNCDTYWTPLYFESREDRVSLVQAQDPGTYFGEFPPVLPERSISLSPLAEAFSEDDVKKHQFGGEPLWVQSEEKLACPKCKKLMKFAAQIDSDEDAGIQFGDLGTLYAFFCDQCLIVATFMQCH
jgi:hypothetical protein